MHAGLVAEGDEDGAPDFAAFMPAVVVAEFVAGLVEVDLGFERGPYGESGQGCVEGDYADDEYVCGGQPGEDDPCGDEYGACGDGEYAKFVVPDWHGSPVWLLLLSAA